MQQKLHLGLNPIIVKELRARMRDARAFITITLVLLLLGGSSYLIYRIALQASMYSSAPVSPQIGQALFIALTFLVLVITSAVAPAVTAGAISSEKEKLTYEMLLATPLRPGSILWGKLISALSYVFLLIFAAVPMFSLIFIFGGVTLRDMVKALIILMVLSITFGMLGLFMSAWLGRTARATVASYVVVAALYVVPLVAYASVGIFRQAEPPRWLLVASPMSTLFSAIATNPISGSGWNVLYALGLGLGGNFSLLTGSTTSMTGIPRPIYHYSLPLYGVLTLVLYLLSTHLILPARRWQFRRREVLITLGVLLLVIGLISGLFLLTSNRYERASIFTMPPPPDFNGNMGFPAEERAVMAVEVKPEIVPGKVFNLNDEQQANQAVEIYSAVARQLSFVEHVLGSGTEAPVYSLLQLVQITDDSAGDPALSFMEPPMLLPEPVQAGISADLAGQPSEEQDNGIQVDIVWVETIEQAQLSSSEASSRMPAAIVFGSIYDQGDETVRVSAAIYTPAGARGKTFILAPDGDTWMVVGDTGREWMR